MNCRSFGARGIVQPTQAQDVRNRKENRSRVAHDLEQRVRIRARGLCEYCNRNKGPNLVGIDKKTREIAKLYHPRRDRWAEHFRWHGPRLRGLTPTGRATIQVLAINDSLAVALRRELILEGVFPPQT